MRPRRAAVAGAVLSAVGLIALSSAAGATSFGANWQLNETAGPMTDSSGNGNTSSSIGPGITRNGQDYDFRGQGVVVVPDSPSLRPGSRDLSMTVRVKFWAGGDRNIVQKGTYSAAGTQYKTEIVGPDLYCFFHGNQAKAAVVAPGVVRTDGKWHVVSCHKRSSAISVVFDGQTHTRQVTIGSIGNTKAVSIGGKTHCRPVDCDYFAGALDYVRITSP